MSEPIGDENFVIEGFYTDVIEHDTFTMYEMNVKVRNLTEFNPPDVHIYFRYTPIDKNGDALSETRYLGCTDIAYSGKAQWLEAKNKEEGTAGVRIIGYMVDGNQHLQESFETPIELYISDYKTTYSKISG